MQIELLQAAWEQLINGEGMLDEEALFKAFIQLGALLKKSGDRWQLINKASFFNSAFLQNQLTHRRVIVHAFTNSTNDDLWKLLSKPKIKMNDFLVLAEYQLKGRGTRGRVWCSPPLGGGICFSFNHAIKHCLEGETVGLKVALAMVNYFSSLGFKPLMIKWPNDVIFQNKKIAGILTEGSSIYPNQLAVGVGINWYLPNGWELKITQPATGLQNILFNKISRNECLVNLFKRIERQLKEKLSLQEYRRYDFWYNKRIRLIWKNQQYEGIGYGIDYDGNFLLKTASDIIKCKPLSVNFLE